MRTKDYRRHKDWVKIKRKIRYARVNTDVPHGIFRKGKNFCSCMMCTPKTNLRGKTMCGGRGGKGKSATRARYKGHNWKHSDRKKIEKCNQSLKEFQEI